MDPASQPCGAYRPARGPQRPARPAFARAHHAGPKRTPVLPCPTPRPRLLARCESLLGLAPATPTAARDVPAAVACLNALAARLTSTLPRHDAAPLMGAALDSLRAEARAAFLLAALGSAPQLIGAGGPARAAGRGGAALLKFAAAANVTEAQLALADRHLMGRGLPPSCREGIRYLRLAAETVAAQVEEVRGAARQRARVRVFKHARVRVRAGRAGAWQQAGRSSKPAEVPCLAPCIQGAPGPRSLPSCPPGRQQLPPAPSHMPLPPLPTHTRHAVQRPLPHLPSASRPPGRQQLPPAWRARAAARAVVRRAGAAV